MKIVQKYDRETMKDIIRSCESKTVKGSYGYIDFIHYHRKNIFVFEIIDDIAFFAGYYWKNHFRLLEMAIKKEYQKKGYGTAMIIRIKKLCKKNNFEKITLRTSKDETALEFFKKQGGVITGEKGNDFEMEIKV